MVVGMGVMMVVVRAVVVECRAVEGWVDGW